MSWKQSIVGEAAAADTSLERPKIDEQEDKEDGEEEEEGIQEEEKDKQEEEEEEEKSQHQQLRARVQYVAYYRLVVEYATGP